MSRSRYFEVERSDGKPANILDYICAAIMAGVMALIIVPYLIVVLLFVAMAAIYVNVRYWLTGEGPHR